MPIFGKSLISKIVWLQASRKRGQGQFLQTRQAKALYLSFAGKSELPLKVKNWIKGTHLLLTPFSIRRITPKNAQIELGFDKFCAVCN
jgi:hypothetical protein